eukprot:9564579-Alexandrium_andersonii.AAC.1
MVPLRARARGGSVPSPGQTPSRSSTLPRPLGAVMKLAPGLGVTAPGADRTLRRGGGPVAASRGGGTAGSGAWI